MAIDASLCQDVPDRVEALCAEIRASGEKVLLPGNANNVTQRLQNINDNFHEGLTAALYPNHAILTGLATNAAGEPAAALLLDG